jgi:hypothetical protein
MQPSVVTKLKCNENGIAKNGAIAMLQKMLLKTVQQNMLLKCCYRRRCENVIAEDVTLEDNLSGTQVYINPFFFLCLFFWSMSPCRENDYECCARRHLLIFLRNQGRRQQQMQHFFSTSSLLMKPRHKINTSAPHYHFLLFFLALQKTTMS